MTTLTMNTADAALVVRGIHKHYGMGKNQMPVLNGLNMTVQQGTIYGLLGASGCGKTTLLRCCLGRLRYESGTIIICGKPPLTRGHGVPGPMVGYMPQETALYGEFTIYETLTYFGTLCKMRKDNLQARKAFLLELLHLPKPTSLVSNLSGGQKRRVSFAVALLHSPQLLILDEPTVGVDPMLRMRIWEHLLNLTKGGKSTVIMTTHYIEEARQADSVGLMRSGKLLSESPPQDLMSYHQMQTLEGVFLKLCMRDTSGNLEVAAYNCQQTSMSVHNVEVYGQMNDGEPIKDNTEDTCRLLPDETPPQVSFQTSCSRLDFLPSTSNISAMVYKSFIRLIRNPGSIMFSFLIPVIEVCLFCLCIGNPPAGLHMAVVNLDTSPLNYSQLFLQHLDSNTIIQHHYDNFTLAFEDAKKGEYWGTIYMAPTYSTDLIKRFMEGTHVDNETIEGSTVQVQLDLTNQQVAISLEQTLSVAYQDFITELLSSLKINPKIAQLPLQFGQPIYGTENSDFTDFMAPGVILSIIFFLAVSITSLTFVLERKEGLLERTWVAGAKAMEVMLSHVAVQFVIMSIQTAVVLVFILVIFNVPNQGSLLLVILLTLLQGLIGMAYGLFVSSVCDNEISAMQLSLGSFYPLILMSGIMWPLEGVPYPLQYFSYMMPQTYAIECLRCVLGRGWSLNYFDVYMGFVTSFAWAFVLLSLSALMIHLRK